MRVVVTGGLGCIGLAVTQVLAESGCRVIVFDLPEAKFDGYEKAGVDYFFGSILDKTALLEAFSGADAIIHLAAYLGVARTEKNRLRGLDVNINGTANVVNAAVLSGIGKFIFASSSEIYGDPAEHYVSEKCRSRGSSVYAISKLAGEEIVKGYLSFREMEVTILRFFNTFGPRQEPQFVIPRFINAVLGGDMPTVYGSGMQVRSYCYVDDIAKGILLALNRGQSDLVETFNLGNPKNEITLTKLAQSVCECFGGSNDLEPNILGGFQGADRVEEREIDRRVCDIGKAQEVLGFDPVVPLIDGLKHVVSRGLPITRWVD